MIRAALVLFKILVLFALGAYLFRTTDLNSTSDLLMSANISLVTLAVGLMAFALLANAARWMLVTKVLTPPIGVGTAVLGTFEAMFFQQILPTGLGGDASRTLRARDAGVSLSQSVYGVIVDRANGLLFVALSILGAGWLSNSLVIKSRLFWVLLNCSVAISIGALGAIVVGVFISGERLPRMIRTPLRITQEYSRCMRNWYFLTLTLACLFASNAMYILSFKYCALALGVPIAWWDAIIIVQGMVLVSIIPFSIGGWGLREGAALLLFAPLHIQPSSAVAVSVLFGLVLTLLAIFGGTLWFTCGYKRFYYK
ncbi:MAG: lysylphosphatidylglycerol synthase transmembrane domain-containing protein [bacterium]